MTSLSESFDKVNGALGPDLTWTVTFGNLEVSGNEAVSPNLSPLAGTAVATESVGADQAISATMGTVPSGPAGLRLFGRWSDVGGGGENAYKLDIYGDTTDPTMTYELYPFSGAFFATAQGPVLVEGQVMQLQILGDALKVYADDVLVIDDSSTDVGAGDLFGFGLDTGTAIASFGVSDTAGPVLGTMFMPPSFGRIPTTWPRGHEMNALMRNFRPRQEGTNVFLTSADEITETDPDSVNLFWTKEQGSPYVKRAFWGSTADPYELTEAEATLLTDAGYSLQ